MPTYSNISIYTTPNLSYIAGDYVQIAHDANNFIIGQIVSYNPTNGYLTVSPSLSVGSGNYSSWSVNLTGIAGTSGTNGTSASSGSSGTNGTSGTNGVSGTSAISGTSATSAIDGTSATSGTSGSSAISGTSGT